MFTAPSPTYQFNKLLSLILEKQLHSCTCYIICLSTQPFQYWLLWSNKEYWTELFVRRHLLGSMQWQTLNSVNRYNCIAIVLVVAVVVVVVIVEVVVVLFASQSGDFEVIFPYPALSYFPLYLLCNIDCLHATYWFFNTTLHGPDMALFQMPPAKGWGNLMLLSCGL